MRWTVALALFAVVATGPAGAAPEAQRVQYFNATGKAFFIYSLDYGSHPDAVFNGRYTASLSYTIKTIVSFDGRRIRTVTTPMVDGRAAVSDQMTVWTGGPRTPTQCQERPSHVTNGARRSSGAHLSVGSGISHIDPGNAIRWPVGCSATETLAAHGLPAGKTITGGASVRAFRSGFACTDNYSHQADATNPNGHSFVGGARFSLKFSPIGRGTLADATRALRRQAGRTLRYREPPNSSFRDCLDPGSVRPAR
jgi:hypothetical protein